MQKRPRFFALFFLTLLLISGGTVSIAAQGEGDLSEDLNKVLKSFDGKGKKNKNRGPTREELYPAQGTLIFFDNSEALDEPVDFQQKTTSKDAGFIQRTLDRAKRRLFQREADQQQERFVPTFVSPSSQDTGQTATYQGRTVSHLALDYDGEKTTTFIPPDALVEIPFLSHIPYFFSRIEIYANGSIGVTETIQRVVQPGEIFYGINRYFSKYHTDRANNTYRTQITVLEASVNGMPIETKLLPSTFGIRLSTEGEHQMAPGVYTYVITYLFPNKVAEFKNQGGEEDFKELVWSVTGSHWDIPITRAGAVIIFPQEAEIKAQAAFTGSTGRRTNLYRVKKDVEGNLSFTLTYPLAQGEALRVMANWIEKDPAAVPPESWLDIYIAKHGTATASGIAFFFILSYYLATWITLKKEQATSAGKIKPIQKGDFSPTVLYYALKKKTDGRALMILLTSMASKGFMNIGEDNNGALLLIKKTDKDVGLDTIEKKAARFLFPKNETSFALTEANKLRLERLMQKAQSRIRKEYDQKYITLHQGYFWFGILMATLSVIFISSLSLFGITTFMTAFMCVALSVPLYFLIQPLYKTIRMTDEDKFWPLLLQTLVILPFLTALGLLLYFYGVQTTFLTSVLFLMTIICICVFYSLLKSPSMLGRSIMDNVEGYRLYLSAQNDTMLTALRNATQKIKALYNKHLPFAIAFDLDKSWTQRFVSFSDEQNDLKPDWYTGKLSFNEDFTEELQKQIEEALPKKVKKSASSRSFRKSSLKN